ncbi:MAG: FtsW/RodA/SpoVE family cell cycle protein, partial [Gammaproteobacteria bacterium]
MHFQVESRAGLFERLHIDLPLLGALVVLSAVGLVVLYSAGGQDEQIVTRQGIRLGIAFCVMLLVAQLTPSLMRDWSPWLYVVGIAALVAVLLFGEVAQGAQRWLKLGPVRFQPSEIAKITVPLVLAFWLGNRRMPPGFFRLMAGAALVVVPAALIMRQPDLGTALLIACSGAFVMFLSGMSWRLIVVAGGLAGEEAERVGCRMQ